MVRSQSQHIVLYVSTMELPMLLQYISFLLLMN